MKQNKIHRDPAPSRATRRISRRSRASLRGTLVAKLPGFGQPRILQFESALEYAFLCLMLIRQDIFSIWDQPPAIAYINEKGQSCFHTFDFLVTLADGEKIAVAIKPSNRVIHRGFLSELELISASVTKSFADRVLVVTEQHLCSKSAAAAARQLAGARPSLTEVAA